MQDILQQMRNDGIEPPLPLIPDEKIHKFPVSAHDKKNSGWYRGFRNSTRNGIDFYVFLYGNWRESPEPYKAISGVKLDKQDKARMQEQIRKAQRQAELEKKELQDKAAFRAKTHWETLSDSPGKNEYLDRKKIKALYGARLSGFDLHVPMRNVDGELKNIERIIGNGEIKKGFFGAQRIGLSHTIGELGDVVFICEGFSTGVAIHESLNAGVVCAFNSGNLVPVATEFAKKYPNRRIVVLGDNDQFPNKVGDIANVGAIKAEEAATGVGGKFLIPQFLDQELDRRPTDFKDLFDLRGPDEVRRQISGIDPEKRVDRYDAKYVVDHPYPDETPGTFVRRGTMANLIEMLRRLGVTVRYNVISKDEEILIPHAAFSIDNRANATLAHILDWCERCKIPHGNLVSYLTAIADSNPYNPVTTWIKSKPWDGQTRLAEFCGTIEAENEKIDSNVQFFKNTLMEKWMLSAIAAAFNPNGVSAHGVLTLQGAQNMGKTSWLKSLVPKDLSVVKDGVILNPHDKDSVFIAVSHWLVELGELDATFKRADIAQLKAFLTKETDTLRRPFAKKESTYARRTVFFGSVNESDFLRDPTGNRRFWAIQCEKINYQHGLDMQQVWAEFLVKYQRGETWILDADEIEFLNLGNEELQAVDPVEERIKEAFSWGAGNFETAMTATKVCQEIGIENPSELDARRAGRALRKLTGKKPRKSHGHSVFDVPLKIVTK